MIINPVSQEKRDALANEITKEILVYRGLGEDAHNLAPLTPAQRKQLDKIIRLCIATGVPTTKIEHYIENLYDSEKEDRLNEVMTDESMYRSIFRGYDENRPFLNFLATAVSNRCLDICRKKPTGFERFFDDHTIKTDKRQDHLGYEPLSAIDEADKRLDHAGEQEASKIKLSQLKKLIDDRINALDTTTHALRYYLLNKLKGQSHGKISKSLNVPLGTVKTRLNPLVNKMDTLNKDIRKMADNQISKDERNAVFAYIESAINNKIEELEKTPKMEDEKPFADSDKLFSEVGKPFSAKLLAGATSKPITLNFSEKFSPVKKLGKKKPTPPQREM